MQTILITGGAGFIGSNFIPYFLDKNPKFKIVNLDKLTYAGDLFSLKEVENNVRYHLNYPEKIKNNFLFLKDFYMVFLGLKIILLFLISLTIIIKRNQNLL